MSVWFDAPVYVPNDQVVTFRVGPFPHPPARWAVQHEGSPKEYHVCDGCVVEALSVEGVNSVWELDPVDAIPCDFDNRGEPL